MSIWTCDCNYLSPKDTPVATLRMIQSITIYLAMHGKNQEVTRVNAISAGILLSKAVWCYMILLGRQ